MSKLTPPSEGQPTRQTAIGALLRAVSAKLHRFYFRAIESTGTHKRDILITRVESARDGLEDAKAQFENALEKFSALAEFDGGPLEDTYRQLKIEFDYSKSKALAVKDRIDAVQEVAEALFNEWEEELDQYSNRGLRSASRMKLKQTQQMCGQLLSAMRRAESKIDPVLSVFQDHVLFLKHNLNAQAIASLEGELATMSVGVAGLISAMERSIERANSFMQTMNAQKALATE
jgi:hypothetical protein